jgi:hypothetical protein
VTPEDHDPQAIAGVAVDRALQAHGERPLRVLVPIGDVEHSWTIDEAQRIIWRIHEAINALKVKCSTCRCRILPGSVCGCCMDPLSPAAEPLI